MKAALLFTALEIPLGQAFVRLSFSLSSAHADLCARLLVSMAAVASSGGDSLFHGQQDVAGAGISDQPHRAADLSGSHRCAAGDLPAVPRSGSVDARLGLRICDLRSGSLPL